MRRAKKHLLSLAAALIAVAGVWAMHATKHSSQKFDTYYYHYLGNDDQLSSYQTQSNWELLSEPDAPGCSIGSIPCVVESDQNTVQNFVSSIVSKTDVEGHEYSKRNPTP